MFLPRIRTALLAVAAAFSVSACGYYDDYGYGYGGGLSVGYNSAGYYDPYYGYGYGGYGWPSYYGWYNDFYYPGTGFYIYDRRGQIGRASGRARVCKTV